MVYVILLLTCNQRCEFGLSLLGNIATGISNIRNHMLAMFSEYVHTGQAKILTAVGFSHGFGVDILIKASPEYMTPKNTTLLLSQ